MTRAALALSLLFTSTACAAQDASVQPRKIPGTWKLAAPALPPLAQARRGDPARLACGLYAWAGEYRKYRAAIKKVGWTSVRIAGPLDDAGFRMMAVDGLDILMTLGTRVHREKKNREHYPSDELCRCR